MEFNSTKAAFRKEGSFTDSMKRFVSEEAAIFSHEEEEIAAASFDKAAEKIVRFSADKDRSKAKAHREILKEIETGSNESEIGHIYELREDNIPSKPVQNNEKGKIEAAVNKDMAKFTDSPSVNEGNATVIAAKPERTFEAKEKSAETDSAKSGKNVKSKETRKAAAKTAVANMLKAKADMSNDIGTDKVSGDAMADGNSGLVKTFTTVINPMTYVKGWLAKIGAIVAPYILIFTTVAAVVFIIVALLFSILQPMSEVGDALSGFIGTFTGAGGGLRNTAFTEDEIDEIVADSGANKTQEKVIRFALSKVGYPYSQDLRTSGKAYDCSSLAYYSWEAAGVDISYGTNYPPTAAEGARMLEANGKKISASDLKPGDLIYYGGEANGRYMGIYHVAIYVGNGMAAEALCTKYGVVYQKLRTNNACMICRPKS